jgi:C4-dicarboxylate-specific signal transduction histidine kinase
MPDPGSGDAVAQIIAATGTALAAVLGAVVLWPTRRRRERAATAAATEDPEDRVTRLRERLTRLETRVDAHDDRIEHVEETTMLLRAQEITAEAHARPRRRSAQ